MCLHKSQLSSKWEPFPSPLLQTPGFYWPHICNPGILPTFSKLPTWLPAILSFMSKSGGKKGGSVVVALLPVNFHIRNSKAAFTADFFPSFFLLFFSFSFFFFLQQNQSAVYRFALQPAQVLYFALESAGKSELQVKEAT